MLPCMMRGTRILLLSLLLMTLGAACSPTAKAQDPLAAEIERWSAFLQSKDAAGKAWAEVKPASQPELARAQEDLKDGRRLLALLRLSNVRESLATTAYLSRRPVGQRKDMAGLEAEWTRMGGELRRDLGGLDAPSPAALDGVRPAAARALGETALLQVRGYYEASLEYGRNTMPGQGLYYLGNAQAQRELVDFLRTLPEPSSSRAVSPPSLRSLRPELDALEADLLAAYRPPSSIDRHGEFIVASSTLKEARELDAAGLRYGAMLRYLQAARRIAPLRQPSPRLADSKQDWQARLAAGDVDHSIGRLFLEISQDSSEDAPTLTEDVLPRYLAALEPARPEPPRPEPRATVTLVRWPYT